MTVKLCAPNVPVNFECEYVRLSRTNRGSLFGMSIKTSEQAGPAAGSEEWAATYVSALRTELRRQLAGSRHQVTALSRKLGHSPSYLSSGLAAEPRTELRLSTVIRLLGVLDMAPSAFFFDVFSQVDRGGYARRSRIRSTKTSDREARTLGDLEFLRGRDSQGAFSGSAAILRVCAELVESFSRDPETDDSLESPEASSA